MYPPDGGSYQKDFVARKRPIDGNLLVLIHIFERQQVI
jgi:hypothetical protein